MPRSITDILYSFINFVPCGFAKSHLASHWTTTPVLSQHIPDIGENISQKYIGNSVSTWRFLSGCSGIGKKRFSGYCCKEKHNLKTSMSLGCEKNKEPRPHLVSSRNLHARDASGAQRLSYLIISWQINSRGVPSIYKESAESVSRKENSSRVHEHAIRNQTFSSAEMGIFWPHSSNFSALKLDHSRRLLALSNNEYLNQSSRFRAELDEIKNKRDRFKRSWPSPSQLTAASHYIFSSIRAGDWDEDVFFSESVYQKIYDVNFALRHTSTPRRTQRWEHQLLPPIPDMLHRIDGSNVAQSFVGNSQADENNRFLRDRITAKLLENILNEKPLIIDNEDQLNNQIRSIFGPRPERFCDLEEHNGARREPPPPTSLCDLEISLTPSMTTKAKFEEKKLRSMTASTSYRGEKDQEWPYFWNTMFPEACKTEAQISLEKASGARQIPPLFDFPDNSIICQSTDQSQVYSSSVFYKDPKYLSSCLYARSHGLALSRNKTASLISRQEMCQSIPIQDGAKSCVSENLEPCDECRRYDVVHSKPSTHPPLLSFVYNTSTFALQFTLILSSTILFILV